MALEPEHILDAEVVAALAEALRPAELSARERDRMRARIVSRVKVATPDGTLTVRARDGIWEDYAPGVQIKVLREQPELSAMTFLVRMAPGSVAPVHSHSQEEHCLVLAGAACMGYHIPHPGAWHTAPP